ncbi:MAG: SusC/RagA family TonB-linked outer membrane protein [Niabella sp.]
MMRLLTFVLFLCCVQAMAATGYSQYVTINCKNEKIEQVLQKIERQTGYSFFYNDQLIRHAEKVTLSATNMPLKEVLNKLLSPNGLGYSIEDNVVIIARKNSTTGQVKSQPQVIAEVVPVVPVIAPAAVIHGTIKNEKGDPVGGASVVIVGTQRGTSTNTAGVFEINAEPGQLLLVTAIGYEPYQLRVTNGVTTVTITLKQTIATGENVVVNTGMFTRNKNTYSGAVSVFSGEQLKNVGNQNVLQSLKTLDPSFIITENNLQGSNPNVLPNIEIRGQSSMSTNTLKDQFSTDPNLPLFVLDGFVVSLRTISDLDMNRVASITILKDAASAAIYGAKAANGVVVIETVVPKPGQMRLSYTADLMLDAPDLRDYNMMNATEELEFERLAGRYEYTSSDWDAQYQLDREYAKRLALVKQGVNTYWLSEPVRTGFTHGHSLTADGGDETVRYSVGANYKNIGGVMKGSKRENYGGNFMLTYRKGRFNISNRFNYFGSSADDSPYGSFSTFVKAPAYYSKRDADGIVQKYLDITRNIYGDTSRVSNPLYNALLPQVNNTKYNELNNNLAIIYTINKDLRLEGGLSLIQGNMTTINFIPPENTAFDGIAYTQKGRYTNSTRKAFQYQGYAQLVLGKVFNRIHQVNANLRTEVEQNKNELFKVTAVGFPPGSTGNPTFSMGYNPGDKPDASKSVYRRNNALLSVNYVFDGRIFADASIRADGSTAFGRNEKYTTFWSAGLGWNVNRERFMSDIRWVNNLRLRASIATNGNQEFGTLTSVATYSYDSYINLFGQALNLATIANPDLEWQKTRQTNLGMDVALFRSRFSFTGNVYNKYTSPLVVVVPLPSSTGLSGYPLNSGAISTNGFDVTAKYSIIYKLQQRFIWQLGVTAGAFKSKYEDFNNTLAQLNKLNQMNNYLERYYDGYSPYDLWAVRSMGIDPSTGREVFLKKNGEYTFDYNANDVVRIGNGQPKAQGILSSNFSYKGFFVSVALRYSFGAYIMNSALFNKVENITWSSVNNNQDKRALYDRWKQPGDEARFKAIGLVTKVASTATPMSSRFMQKENYLSGESFSVGYDFDGYDWVKKAGMQFFRVQLYTNDIFRASTILRERGIDYPYSNSFSLSIKAGF